jgi:hypothetical protein
VLCNGDALFNFYLSFDYTETGDYVIAEICLPEELPNKTLSDRSLGSVAQRKR